MTQSNLDERTAGSLGGALSTLSDSADGLSTNVQNLQRVMNDLETSTERWSENQAAASESLAQAADNLAPNSRDGPSAAAADTGFAVADD